MPNTSLISAWRQRQAAALDKAADALAEADASFVQAFCADRLATAAASTPDDDPDGAPPALAATLLPI